MGFSDKMRESLGAEGAKVTVETSDEAVRRGERAPARIVIHGGTTPARVEALVLRVIEARRHWVDAAQNGDLSEEQAQTLDDRSHLMPAWTRATIQETVVDVGHEVLPGDSHEIAIDVPIPDDCGTTAPSCVITLNAQADIRGRIDPTGNARLHIV